MASICMQVTSIQDELATSTCSKTCNTADTTTPTNPTTTSTNDKVNATPPLTEDQRDTLRLMQRMDSFCKCISKRLLSGKVPLHVVDTFTHIKGLSQACYGFKPKIFGTSHPQVLAFYSTC